MSKRVLQNKLRADADRAKARQIAERHIGHASNKRSIASWSDAIATALAEARAEEKAENERLWAALIELGGGTEEKRKFQIDALPLNTRGRRTMIRIFPSGRVSEGDIRDLTTARLHREPDCGWRTISHIASVLRGIGFDVEHLEKSA